MARRKKTTAAICSLLFALVVAPFLAHLGILAACAAGVPPVAVCQFADRLALGRGALVPGLITAAVGAVAVLIGCWCGRNVLRDGHETRYLLAETSAGRWRHDAAK